MRKSRCRSEAGPRGGDIARVADRQGDRLGGLAQRIHDLEGQGLLAGTSRVVERIAPEASADANRARLRAVVLNRRLYDYDEELRTRHRVIVLDDALSERLPPPPAMP